MGIFDTQQATLFTTYHAKLTFRDKVMGGTPKDPKIITSWLRVKTGVTDDEEELRRMMLRTLLELGATFPEGVDPANATHEQLVEASERLANKQAVGFKCDPEHGLYLEGRVVKSMLKENTNILFPYQSQEGKWGATKKAARSYLAERVFVNPDRVWLGRKEPDGVDLFIGHTNGPSGPQSNLTYYEYVARATIEFDVIVAQDGVKADHWPQIWVMAQENALGALRSQGFGRFEVMAWDKVRGGTVTVPKAFADAAQEPVAVS